jgi:hypothetical protein
MPHTFIDYFRCPEQYVSFSPLGVGCGEPGYFRFGADAIGYGQVSVGLTSVDVCAELADLCSEVRIENGTCCMPFEPASVVENLRRERYVTQDRSTSRNLARSDLFRKAYYSVRPLLPVSVRKHLQRISLRGWDKIPFPRWPVDRSVDKIFEKLMMLTLESQEVDKIPFIWFWPEGKSACVILTHDVETKTGLDFCPPLMALDHSYGMKSSFQIIPEGRYHTPERVLDEMRRSGFEVNVHDWNHDGFLFSDRQVFLSRAIKINEAVARLGAEGFRAGVMYRNTEWFDAFTFSYDMSVPNVGHLDPQRGGCCTVMPYFIGRLLEIPLTTVQDYSLFYILQDYSIDLWTKQISLILERHGLVSFNIHPDYVIESRARVTYTQLLELLSSVGRESNVWLAQPREVNRWWRERSQMRLVQQNGRLEIEGPGSSRARLAYANSDGRRLIYTFE